MRGGWRRGQGSGISPTITSTAVTAATENAPYAYDVDASDPLDGSGQAVHPERGCPQAVLQRASLGRAEVPGMRMMQAESGQGALIRWFVGHSASQTGTAPATGAL